MLFMNSSPEVKQGVEQLPSSGHPVRHSGCSGIEVKQLSLLSDQLVISFLCLPDQILVCLQGCLVRKSIRIHSGHLITMLVASPVSAGDAAQLKCCRQKILGILNVRSSAQIHIIVAGVVDCDRLILRKLLNQLRLKALSLENLQCLCPGDLFSGPVLLALQNLTHLIFDLLEIGLLNSLPLRQDEIIIKPVIDLRSDGILGLLAIKLQNRLGQNMSQ